MGEFGNADWEKSLKEGYASECKHGIEDRGYFKVIVYMKFLASAVISFVFSAKELGLREEAAEVTKKQFLIDRRLSLHIYKVTGIKVPELEEMFASV